MNEPSRLQKKFLSLLETDRDGSLFIDRQAIEEIPRKFRICHQFPLSVHLHVSVPESFYVKRSIKSLVQEQKTGTY